MKILLYNPDNGVTRNFMPHLWMFLLQAITPPGHEVILIDANARAMSDDEIVQFVREQNIELVGIGAMTRMAEKAYRVADAIRSAGVPVVMGGPHVTEVPDEALGRDGGPRHADAIALGEADETWPQSVMNLRRFTLLLTSQAKNGSRVYNRIRRSPGNLSIWINSISFHVFCALCCRGSARAGARFASFRSSQDEAVLMVASFAQ